jgi:hypothetical protein
VAVGGLPGEGFGAVARSRRAPAGQRRRAGEQSGAVRRGAGVGPRRAAGLRGAARRARCEPAAAAAAAAGAGGEPARGGGGGRGSRTARRGASGPIVSRRREARSERRSDGGPTCTTPRAAAPGGARARRTHKRQPSSPGARTGPCRRRRSPPYRLSFPSNSHREAGPTRALEGPGQRAGGRTGDAAATPKAVCETEAACGPAAGRGSFLL